MLKVHFKKTISLVLGSWLFLVGFTARAQNFEVNIVDERLQEQVLIEFRARQMSSNICQLSVSDFYMTPSYEDPSTRIQVVGQIHIQVSVMAGQRCAMAFGYHRGSLLLYRGSQIPQLSLGIYELLINNERYGSLVIQKDGAFLVP